MEKILEMLAILSLNLLEVKIPSNLMFYLKNYLCEHL
jgi:hypothetical protein